MSNTPIPPRIGIIGGSGLGNAILQNHPNAARLNIDTPFGKPSAQLLTAEWANPTGDKIPIAFLARHGDGHTIPPSAVPYRANIWAPKSVGCKWIIASGAVGSLREEIAPQDLILVDQVIDKTNRLRANTFFDGTVGNLERHPFGSGGGAVHVEFAQPVCPDLHATLVETATDLKTSIHKRGTYVCMEGPAFSTRAESLMHRVWGGDLVGMTMMPEAKLAREAEISYALIALATDYDSWKPHDPSQNKRALLEEIISNMAVATDHALALIKAAVPKLWAKRDGDFLSHHALELAIWTDKSRIPEESKRRLELLWGRYV